MYTSDSAVINVWRAPYNKLIDKALVVANRIELTKKYLPKHKNLS